MTADSVWRGYVLADQLAPFFVRVLQHTLLLGLLLLVGGRRLPIVVLGRAKSTRLRLLRCGGRRRLLLLRRGVRASLLLVLLVVIAPPIIFALDYLGRLRLRNVRQDLAVGRRHGETIGQVKVVARVNHRQGERLGAIDARHAVPSLDLPVAARHSGFRQIARWDPLLDANLVLISGGGRRCKVFDRLKYVIRLCQLAIAQPYAGNELHGAVIVHVMLLHPVASAILRLSHLVGGLALVLRAVARHFSVGQAPLMCVGRLGWPEQGALLEGVCGHGVSIAVLFGLDLLELVGELLFIKLIREAIVFERCLVRDDVLDRILLEAHILRVEVALVLGVAYVSRVLHGEEALLLQRGLVDGVDRLHGAVLVGHGLSVVAPRVQTLHLVLDLAYHGLVVLGLGLLDRLDGVRGQLLDLLLTVGQLLLLGLAEPLLGLPRVLEVEVAHVLAHGRARLSHFVHRLWIGHVLPEAHAACADMPVVGGSGYPGCIIVIITWATTALRRVIAPVAQVLLAHQMSVIALRHHHAILAALGQGLIHIDPLLGDLLLLVGALEQLFDIVLVEDPLCILARPIVHPLERHLLQAQLLLHREGRVRLLIGQQVLRLVGGFPLAVLRRHRAETAMPPLLVMLWRLARGRCVEEPLFVLGDFGGLARVSDDLLEVRGGVLVLADELLVYG